MDNLIPPVVRGEFQYRDTLLVDVGGELKRHPRASEADIKQYLLGKDPKDQVAHWYEAQLIHYGLQRSKSKDTAKVRLQLALGQGKLKKAPPHLLDMEAQMKKDYAAAVRKAKSKSKIPEASAEPKKGVKRTREDDDEQSSKRTKISVRVGDISFDIDHSDAVSRQKSKAVTLASAQTAAKKANIRNATAKPTPKSRPKKSDAELLEAAQALRNEDSISGPKPKSTPGTSKVKSEPKAQSSPSVKKESKVKPGPKAPSSIKKEPKVKCEPKGSSSVKKKSKVKAESGYNPSSPVSGTPRMKYEKQADVEDRMDTRPDMTDRQINITGIYDLDCPQVAEQSPEHADSCRLFICVERDAGKIWGGFELANRSGVLRVDNVGVNEELSFGWRARNNLTGHMRFGRGCVGEIEFDEDGRVRGFFDELFPGGVTFEGRRRPGPLSCGQSAHGFAQEWNGYVSEAYGR